jgi:hypothetical protein
MILPKYDFRTLNFKVLLLDLELNNISSQYKLGTASKRSAGTLKYSK